MTPSGTNGMISLATHVFGFLIRIIFTNAIHVWPIAISIGSPEQVTRLTLYSIRAPKFERNSRSDAGETWIKEYEDHTKAKTHFAFRKLVL